MKFQNTNNKFQINYNNRNSKLQTVNGKNILKGKDMKSQKANNKFQNLSGFLPR